MLRTPRYRSARRHAPNTNTRLSLEVLEKKEMLSAAPVFELSSLLPENGGDGSRGIVINGIDAWDASGVSVSEAGDVNADGYTDVIIGAPYRDPNGADRAGESYVVFGGESLFVSLDLSALDGTNGFVLSGIDALDFSGLSVSGAGDVNGDGYDDVIVGAYSSEQNGVDQVGESYVVFGSTSFSARVDLSTLNGLNGLVLNGIDSNDWAGFSVSKAGDINGDGYDDIIVGVPGRSVGESYVVFGGANFAASLDLSMLDGVNGFVLNGIDIGDSSGYSVSGAGDVNGDGYDDMIVGAPRADVNGDRIAGESYVVFGGESFSASFDLSALDGTNGFVLSGIDALDFSGLSVSGDGDVNGDGYDDIIIGAYNAGTFAGESYVVFGGAGFSASIDLSTLDGVNGFVLNAIDAGYFTGYSVSSAGDFNSDGYDDIIVGAPGRSVGESYVVFGGANFAASLDLAALDGTNGFVLNGIDIGDSSGASVSSAGDFNGDGYDDVIIGAVQADPSGVINAGESYVVFGSSDLFAPVIESVDVGGDLQSFLVQLNDDDLNSALVTNASNYRITAAGADAVFGTTDDLELSISSIDYEPSTDRITVRTVDAFFDDLFRIEVDGDNETSDSTPGITDLAGNFLDDGDFAADVDLRALSLVADLLVRTEELGLSNGAHNSLTAKLDATLQLLEVDNSNEQGIVAKLDSFIDGVHKWFEKGEIDLPERDELVADAEFIQFGLALT